MSATSEGHVLTSPGSQRKQLPRYFSLQDLRNIALFALAYLAAYGYSSYFAQNVAAPLWFPDSVLLCALLLVPTEKWWFYLVVAAPLRFVPGLRPPAPDWFIWVTFINDAIKAVLAAHLLRYLTGNSVRFNTIRRFAFYLAIAVLLAPMLSALAGAAARHALGYPFWPSCAQWFMGNALTNLVITPALLQWTSGGYRQLRARAIEAALWAIAFAISLGFTVLLTSSNESSIALYAPIPFLVWAAARLGPIGASSGLSLMTSFLMLGISRGSGPFAAHLPVQNQLFVQLFLGLTSLPILFVAILIEERHAVERRLQESQTELNRNYERIRDLAGRLMRVQEEERKRIARELHDDISQQIASLIIGLDGLAGMLPDGMAPERSRLNDLTSTAKDMAESVRELSHQLHSVTLQHLGIARGLEGLCRTFAQQHHVEVNLESEELQDLPDDVSLCLYRVVQEALNNAVKHGNAKHVVVRLKRSKNQLSLEIRDSGSGFNPAAASEGLGLVSMRERMRMVGGTLVLTSSRGKGTIIKAVVEAASGSHPSHSVATPFAG